MHGDVQGRQPVLDDPLEVPRLQIRQSREVSVAERESIVVVPDVEDLPHALRVAVHEAEIAVVGTAPDAGRLECHAQREPLGALYVVLDLLPRWQLRPQHEAVVCGEELPVEKVLEVAIVDRNELGPGDETEGSAQGIGRHRLHTNHCWPA